MGGKVLRLATNSLSTNSVFFLEDIGGPKLPRPAIYLHACMIRTAAKTLSGFQEQHRDLCDLHLHSLTLDHIADVSPRPEGWDSDAYATNLTWALAGRLGNDELVGADKAVSRVLHEYHRGRIKISLQKAIFNALCGCVKRTFDTDLRKRLSVYGIEPSNANIFRPDHLVEMKKNILGILRGLPHYAGMVLIRSWFNSWFTSHRLQENIKLPCIFGCNANDEFKHYLCCEPMWSIVLSSCNAHAESLSVPSLRRLGLDGDRLSRSHCVHLIVASQSYHALRNLFPQVIASAIESKEFDELLLCFCDLCVQFAAEMGQT